VAGQAAGPGGFRHAALLHRDPEEFTAGVLGFVRAGVRAHEPVLVAGSGPGLRLLRAELGAEDDLVTWSDLARCDPGPGVVDLMRSFALRYAGRPVRCVQEVAWPGRPHGDTAETMRQETLINRAFAQVPATIMCAYDTRAAAGVLAGAERAHPSLIRAGQAQPSRHFAATGPGELPLSPPPAAAMVLRYREDQARLRGATADYGRASGLDEDRVQDVVLAVGELAGNTLKHTSGPGTLTMWRADGELLAQIDDSGHIRGPLPGIQPGTPGLAGSQGLWLVHQLCDLVDIRTGPGGTSIRLHVRLRS
jgi:anti-sigma regulatory factor (Ser/Thr protein kinase)